MYYALGTAEWRAGRLRDAQARFQRAVEKDPGAVPAWLDLERVSAHLGDLEESSRAGREILRLRPDDPDAKADFGRLDSLRCARMGGHPGPGPG